MLIKRLLILLLVAIIKKISINHARLADVSNYSQAVIRSAVNDNTITKKKTILPNVETLEIGI